MSIQLLARITGNVVVLLSLIIGHISTAKADGNSYLIGVTTTVRPLVAVYESPNKDGGDQVIFLRNGKKHIFTRSSDSYYYHLEKPVYEAGAGSLIAVINNKEFLVTTWLAGVRSQFLLIHDLSDPNYKIVFEQWSNDEIYYEVQNHQVVVTYTEGFWQDESVEVNKSYFKP